MLAFILTLLLIIFLSFKRINIVVVAVIAAIVLAVLTGQSILPSLTDTYMSGAANFVRNNFLLFVVSAMFGKVMEETGAANAIAKMLSGFLGEKYAILGVVLSGAVLIYGGVATLVAAFTIYPIALSLFKRADLPRYLIPGAIATGCFTFAAAHLPGTPQVINVIPTTYLGTTTMAAPLVGILVAIPTAVISCVYMVHLSNRARRLGQRFETDASVLASLEKAESQTAVNPCLALVPIVVILIVLNVLNWHVIVSMALGTLICAVLFFKNIKNYLEVFDYSTRNAAMAVINTAAVVGYGSVVQNSSAFDDLFELSTSFNVTPLLSFGIGTTILSAAAGSGTGGLGIALEAMAEQYLEAGLHPEILHRVGTCAGVGLDSLPHNGGVVTLFTLSGTTHRESYLPIFITTVVLTTFGMFLSIFLGALFYPL